MLQALLVLFANGAVVQAATPTVLHGPVRNPSNGHAYYLLSDSTWHEAEAAAVAMGGHLATIRDQFEQRWIFDTFKRVSGVPRNLWIGLYDPDPTQNASAFEVRKGEFAWTSGEPVTFSQWSAREPSNTLGAEFYAHLWEPGIGVEGYWNDLPATVPAIYVGRMGGVVEITRPTLVCSNAVVLCGQTGPEFAGRPTLVGSCSPASEVVFLPPVDRPGSELNTIIRTWTVRDACGEASCEQSIRVLDAFAPIIERQFQFGGLVAEFTIQVGGFTAASWSIDFIPLGPEPGVQILDSGRRLILDFREFRGGTFESSYIVDAQISTQCTGGGASSGGTVLPLFALARTGAVLNSAPNGDAAQPYVNQCATFGANSRWLRIKPEAAGHVAVTLPGTPATAKLTVISRATLPPTELACGTGTVSFPATANAEYLIGVDAPGAAQFECRMVQPPRIEAPASIVVPQDSTSAPLPVAVADADSDVDRLRLSARSSDPELFPAGSFLFGGGGLLRTVTFTPARGRAGDAQITLRVTDTSGAYAETTIAVSVPAAGPRIRFVRVDPEAQGNWRTAYPGFRATVVGATARLPEIPPVVKQDAIWSVATRDPRAPEFPDGRADRVAAAWWASQKLTVRLNLPDGRFSRVAFYFVDWDRAQRQQRITVRDPASGSGLSTNTLTNFGNGAYLVWDIRGPVDVEITNISTVRGLNAVISAILIGDPPLPLAQAVTVDRSTSGNWRNVYGSQGAMIVGVTPRLPALASVLGKEDWPWTRQTDDTRAPEHPAGLPRAAWCWFTPRAMTLSLNLPTNTSTRIAAYFVDWDRLGRVQRVDVRARGATQPLLSETLRDFGGGVYLVWDFRGPVDLVISNLAVQPIHNAVLSGLFQGLAPTGVKASPAVQGLASSQDRPWIPRPILHATDSLTFELPADWSILPGALETSTDLNTWAPYLPESPAPAPGRLPDAARFFRIRSGSD